MRNRDKEYVQNIIDYCLKVEDILSGVDYENFIAHEIY